jgi:hypothetical protein
LISGTSPSGLGAIGPLATRVANWDIAVSSKARLIGIGAISVYNDACAQARNVRSQARPAPVDSIPYFEQAYGFLKQTPAELNRDELYALAGLAENALDHQFAMEIYQRAAADGKDDAFPFKNAPAPAPAVVPNGPIYANLRPQLTSLHTAWLLQRWRKDPLQAGDFAQWLLGPGRNLPLARQVVAANIPRPQNAGDSNTQWNNLIMAKMRISLYDRDWDAVLAAMGDHLSAATANLAIQAAIEKMDYPKVCELGLYLAKDCRVSAVASENSSCLLALAALWLANRDDLADKLVAELRKLDSQAMEKLAASPQADALEMPPLDAKTTPLLDDYVRSGPAPAPDRKPTDVVPITEMGKRLCRRWARSSDLTLSNWHDRASKYFFLQPGMVDRPFGYDSKTQLQSLLVYCKLGKYDRPELASLPAGPTAPVYRYGTLALVDPARNKLAATWLMANQNRLGADWAELVGTITASDGVQKGSHWAVRWDGHVFYVDPEGKITRYDGIETNTFTDLTRTGSVLAFPSGALYATDAQVYVLDEKLKRWVPTFAAPCWAEVINPQPLWMSLRPPGWDIWDTPAAPPALRYLVANYGAMPGHELTAGGAGPDGQRWWLFNGGIGLTADEKSGQVTDLSRRIAAEAKKDKPAKVYCILPLSAQGVVLDSNVAVVTPAVSIRGITLPTLAGAQSGENKCSRELIATDCGLWTIDAQGKPARVELGNKSDLPVAIMDWPPKPGKVYIGMTPQDGGQVFELDLQTNKATLTGGFCGQSGDDAFFVLNDPNNPRRIDYALTAIYEKANAK